jgi:uncharacterized protein
MSPSHVDEVSRERLLAGRNNAWFLGPGGLARLGSTQLTAEGTLRPEARQRLRDLGLYRAPAPRAYLLTVLTSTDCNLGCGYCFQNTGQDLTGGNRPPRIAHARLTSKTITSVLEFAARRMAAAELDKLRVLLFGGEPLLNPRGCLELLERAAGHGLVSAWMISNATLLTPALARQLWDRKLRSIQVTFDGDREEHDRIRIRRSNGGTFDGIVRNIDRASAAAPIQWALRVNVSHHNQHGIDSLIERLADALDTARCSIYFSQVGDIGIGYTNDLSHTREMAARFSRWHRRALDLGFTVTRPGPRPLCQTCGHGDGRYGAVVSADGTLSSCWETAGDPEWRVGTVQDGYLPEREIGDRWVGCEDGYRYHEGEPVREAFQDAVDADLLDYLRETGRL